MSEKKIVYVLEAIRNGSHEEHSYVHGVYFDLDIARKAADDHCAYRAMKYSVIVHALEIDKDYDADSVPSDFDSEVYRAKGYFDTEDHRKERITKEYARVNAATFIKTVEEMRTAQVDYFRTKDKDVLSQSKSLEKRVDKLIAVFKSLQQKLL